MLGIALTPIFRKDQNPWYFPHARSVNSSEDIWNFPMRTQC
jgi:hypothetical protein